MMVYTLKNQTPFVLCIIGGLLLIFSGYNHGAGVVGQLYLFIVGIPALAPYLLLVTVIMGILWLIALSGGFAVILGGYLLTRDHVRIGKFIIMLSAGFGLLSLILYLLWVLYVSGWAGLLIFTLLILNTAWALGLVLTIIARTLAH